MHPDDVMHIANETDGKYWMDEAHIQRFAARLIEITKAKEREECAKVCEGMQYSNAQPHHYAAAIRARGQQ